MNNKGQSLVVFVIILPIILILSTMIWEIGNLQITKSKYESRIKDAIKYGIKHNEDPEIKTKIEELLKQNVGICEVSASADKIKVKFETTYKYMYEKYQEIRIKISMVGYKENEKIIIKKE